MVRVGIVGAGANTRLRHIPGLLAQPGVKLVGVVNRTSESTHRVAEEFGIAKRYDSWQQLVDDGDIDAVVVGTWPNLHADVTCAALAAGKHVLTEARMARSVAEAQQMVLASRKAPQLVSMVVPSPCGLVVGPRMLTLLRDGFLGDLREVVVIGSNSQFHDYSLPLHWRQDAEISGVNVLTLGILHETLTRWVPAPDWVFAQSALFEPTRHNPDGPGELPVTVPDSLQALARWPSGARGVYHFSGIALHGPGLQIHLYGSGGTLKVTFGPNDQETVWGGRCGQDHLVQLEIPADQLGRWRVEEEFIAAIEGRGQVELNTFEKGLADLAFTQAVMDSARSNEPRTVPTLASLLPSS
jgi:predicted dehydrogenase